MKAIFILMCVFFLMFKLSAQEVSFEEARNKAQEFFFATDKSSQRLKSASVVKVDTFATYYTKIDNQLKSARQKEEPAFYIFNRTDKPGFVIVSADKRIREVIAYSNAGVFCELNPGLKALLNQYVGEINFVKENDINTNTTQYDYSLVSDVNILLGSFWGQSPDPFNSLCPKDTKSKNTNGRVSAGCVATAMAQIIYYYSYPRFGASEKLYVHPVYGIQFADFKNTEYKYELMVDNPNYSSVDGKMEEQISNLLYHSAVSTEMDFGYEGSGAPNLNVKTALEEYFKYRNCTYLETSTIHDSWKELIKIQIDKRRPVYYSSQDSDNPIIPNILESIAGHAYVIDGYNNLGQFHINFGWKGCSDGFYQLSLLKPSDCNSKYNFKDLHCMIINIEPKLADLKPVNQSISSSSVQLGSDLTVKCAEDNSGSISSGANVIYIYLSENGVLTPEENGDRKIGEINITSTIEANSSSVVYPQTITIPANVPPKSYNLFFWVDGGKKVTEIWEDNNFASLPLVVTAAPTLNPPTSLIATPGDGQVALSWSKPSSGTPTSYTVYRSTSETGNPTTLTPNVNTLSYSATGLTNGTTYWFKVKANYSSGSSDFSTAISAKPTTVAVTYYPPRNLAAASGDGQVSLCWSGPSSGSPSSYNVYMGSSESGSYSFYGSSATTCKLVTGLTNGTSYWFYVCAVYQNGISDKSNKVSALPKALGSAPSNDNSSSPQSLAIKTSCSYKSYTTINATPPSSDVPFYGSPTCTSLYKTTRYDDDVWFYIQPTSTSPVTITVNPTSNNSNFDIVLGLYNSSLSQITCGAKGDVGASESITFTPQSNTSYFIRVFSYGETSSYSGDFDICVTSIDGDDGDDNKEEDFYVQDQSVSEPTVEEGGTIDVSASQCYSGSKLDSEMENTYLGYYLSSNNSFSKSSDKLLDESPSSLGSDDRCNSESETVTIPYGTTPGIYYIFFVADNDDYFNETDENNNVKYIQITVTAGTGKPDLAIKCTSYPPAIAALGERVIVDYSRYNYGNAIAESHKIGIYISSDTNFDRNTDKFIDDWSRGTLKPDVESKGSLSFYVPDCYVCDKYYVFLVIDYDDLVEEWDENNNSDYFPIEITGCNECTYSIPTTGITFQSAGGSGNFNVTTTQCCEWTASSTDNFITIINGSGIGNGVVNYLVSPSNSGDTRTGTIKVGDQIHSITQNCVEACNNSQSFEWAVKAGSTTLSDAANDLAIDNSGNLFMTGDIQGAATFGGGITLTTPSKAPDIFVSKHNSSGQIQWAVKYGDTDQEYGTGIAADNSGNVYVIGNSQNEVTFENTTLTANGKNEGIAFLLKLNSSGEFQWAKKLNELYDGGASDIVIDKNNNIFITGNLSDYNQDGNGNGFYLAKYNSSGIQAWYNSYGFGFYIKQAFGIATDNLGNLFISGRYMETMTLGSTTMKASATLDMDGFISKLDVNGNVIWAKQLTSPGQGQDELKSIAVDAENNIYTIGKVDSTAIIGNITLPLSDKKDKTIIIKYDPDGNPIWAKISTEGQQYNQQRIIYGNDGNIYFAGNFYSAIKLDDFKIDGIGSNDNFIGCMDSNGKIKWLKGSGSVNLDGLGGVVTNSTNDIFVAGGFYESVAFGNTTLTSSGSEDIFLTKFKQCDPPKAIIVNSGSLVICPGGSKSLETEYCSSYKYQWARNNIICISGNLPK